MGLFAGYRASLKPLEVEEPIDVLLHRPLGYLVARSSFSTPISPDLLTLLSILFGASAGICLVWQFPWHMQVGALLTFSSAVLDCADGQLARMRKSSSAFGRMIDGVADLITTLFVVPATLLVLWRMYDSDACLGGTVVGLGIATIVTSSFHSGMYDHYKNVFLRLTTDAYKEGEDYETALERCRQSAREQTLWKRVAWRVYLFYIGSQRDYVKSFDPFTSSRLNAFPSYNPEFAAIYRKHAAPLMRVWRSLFGFGSMVFGLALFNALERPDIYLALRLVVLNAIFYLYLRPAQRRASRSAFEQMGVRLPDQQWESAK
jgi:hypothetical protein